MDEALAREVWRRADGACEYCLIAQAHYPAPFEIDHIIARQHNGPTISSNLCLSCLHCNSHKGPNLSGLDSRTGKLTPLFNPRRNKWTRHLRWKGAYLIGRTPIGRVTVQVLAMNAPFILALRQALIQEGLFPARWDGGS
jgi:5-methylcytosine-specific restriction endonuclease McrA